jgi:hypothetical protein
MFEAVIAMPTQKMGMWSLRTARGRERPTSLIDEGARSFVIIYLSRDQNFQIV